MPKLTFTFDPKSKGFFLSSSTTYIWSLKVIGQKLICIVSTRQSSPSHTQTAALLYPLQRCCEGIIIVYYSKRCNDATWSSAILWDTKICLASMWILDHIWTWLLTGNSNKVPSIIMSKMWWWNTMAKVATKPKNQGEWTASPKALKMCTENINLRYKNSFH